ncbi:MAG TPA: hypothetical protein PKY05_18820, partial [Fibrobacteria bacterium]|nr:hypothetical protein [Fibrobacteria bacterium]
MERPRQIHAAPGVASGRAVLTILVLVGTVASRPALLVPSKGALEISIGDRDPFTDREDGLVRISGRTIVVAAGAAPRTVSFDDLALSTGTGDTVASRPDSLPRPPGSRVVPIDRVDRNRDGIVDDDDEIRFWVRGTSLWKRDTALGGWIR